MAFLPPTPDPVPHPFPPGYARSPRLAANDHRHQKSWILSVTVIWTLSLQSFSSLFCQCRQDCAHFVIMPLLLGLCSFYYSVIVIRTVLSLLFCQCCQDCVEFIIMSLSSGLCSVHYYVTVIGTVFSSLLCHCCQDCVHFVILSLSSGLCSGHYPVTVVRTVFSSLNKAGFVSTLGPMDKDSM